MIRSDRTKIDELIKEFKSAFADNGEKVDNPKILFHQKGQVFQFLPDEAEQFTIANFIESRIEIIALGIHNDFKDHELSSNTLIDGKNAVRISQ